MTTKKLKFLGQIETPEDETNCDNRVQNNTRWTSVAVARLEEIDQLQNHRLVR